MRYIVHYIIAYLSLPCLHKEKTLIFVKYTVIVRFIGGQVLFMILTNKMQGKHNVIIAQRTYISAQYLARYMYSSC